MTKAELIKALEPFDDDQYVCVLTELGQTIIQGVHDFPPWCGNPPPNLIGIVVHTQNRTLPNGRHERYN